MLGFAPNFSFIQLRRVRCSGVVCDDEGDGPCHCDPCDACSDEQYSGSYPDEWASVEMKSYDGVTYYCTPRAAESGKPKLR